MRILQICADPGVVLDGTKGASVHLRSMAKAFRHRGHEVDMLVANLGQTTDEVAKLSARTLTAGSLARDAGRWGSPDLVYERYAMGHDGGLRAARELGCPLVLEVNAPLVLEASRHRPGTVRPGDQDVERRLFRSADLVVAVSEPLRRYVAEIRGTDRGTIVVRNGCEPGRFPSAAPLAKDPPLRLAFLGHPKPWHGAEILPRVIADLRRREWDVELVVIGGGPGAERLAERALEFGVADHVDITGALSSDHAAARLLEATAAVAPFPPDSFFYFCPIKVIECMAAGLPVVTVAQGDVPDIVQDTGVLVAPGDYRAFLQGVEALLRNEPLRRGLGTRARERALSRFTWDHAAGAVLRAAAQITRVSRRVA